MFDFGILLGPLGIVLGVIVLIIVLLSCWRKVAADKAMVITGLQKRVLSGKGGFMIPVLETSCVISLENMSMTTDVTEAPSKQGIFVDVVGTAVVKVDNTPSAVCKAVEQFCNGSAKNTKDTISSMVEQILEGKLRGIVSTMTVEQINEDRAAFEKKIEEDINRELEEMGLKLLSYSILKIATQGGYLENRARPQVAQSKADAEVAEAERRRDTDIKTAQAVREGQKVKLAADAEIAAAERDRRIKVEQFRAEQDRAKADADVAYKLQEIENARSVAERDAELAKKRAIVVEEQLVADVKKPADARRYQVEIDAEAEKSKAIRQAEADAERIRLAASAHADATKIEAQAEADKIRLKGVAEADAVKAQGIAEATAEAEMVRQKGLAEAEAIRQKGLAEAEAKDKLADAMAKYGEAAVMEMLIRSLPDIMGQIASPMSNIDKITVIDGGDEGNGAAKVARTVTNVAGTGFEVLKDLTGVDLSQVLKNLAAPKTPAPTAPIPASGTVKAEDTVTE